jgi:hypothetical protein
LSKEVSELKYEAKVLAYAVSIVPEEIKGEMFINSVKSKFEDVKSKPELMLKLGYVVDPIESEESEQSSDINYKMNPSTAMNVIMDGQKSN